MTKKAKKILKAIQSSYLKGDNCGGYWKSYDPTTEEAKEYDAVVVFRFCNSDGEEAYITKKHIEDATFEGNTIFDLSYFGRLELYNLDAVKI